MSLELKDATERAKSILNGIAIGGSRDDREAQSEYKKIRGMLISEAALTGKVPSFIKSCRELHEFWSYIKPKFPTYRERQEYLKEAFEPLLSYFEATDSHPSITEVTGHLSRFSYDEIQSIWTKALERKKKDPDGAITAARTLLESTLKHILDELEVTYNGDADLPKLYHLTALQLNLAPSQHTEHLYKQVLGGCKSVVEGLGAVRSKLGDAHGKGKNAPRPSTRHAELSVNLAGAVAVFLLQTWEEHKKSNPSPKMPTTAT